MELSIDAASAERIAWAAWGVLSFIAYRLVSLAWHPGGSKRGDASRGAEKKRTRNRKREINRRLRSDFDKFEWRAQAATRNYPARAFLT
jgi:hypothetical protein